MNWDAIGAIAEAVGVLVVVGSLFYIAAQIKQNSSLLKQNSELARAAMIHQTNVSATQATQQIAQSEELASIIFRGKSGQELDEVEQTRYLAIAEIQLTWLEDIDIQHQAGLFIDEENDPDPIEDMIPYYGGMLRPMFVKKWWESGAKYYFSRGFREKMENIMTKI